MRPDIAELVYPVVLRALHLRDRLARGEEADFETEQAALRGMLQAEPAGREAEAGAARPQDVRYLPAGLLAGRVLHRLHALGGKPLEGTEAGDGPVRHQRPGVAAVGAGLARPSGLGDADALEVFFLSVLLGFRGDAPPGAGLGAWVVAARARQGRLRPWPAPAEREPPTDVPPLRWRGRLRRAVLLCGLLLLLLTPLAAVFIAKQLGQ